MVELTEQQRQAVATSDAPARLVDPVSRQKYVLVREEVYEALRRLAEPLNRAGWDDPRMDLYEDYRDKP